MEEPEVNMRTWQTLARAKINLTLDIVERRADGYHALDSVFQSLSWGDTLTLKVLSVEETQQWISRHPAKACAYFVLPDGQSVSVLGAVSDDVTLTRAGMGLSVQAAAAPETALEATWQTNTLVKATKVFLQAQFKGVKSKCVCSDPEAERLSSFTGQILGPGLLWTLHKRIPIQAGLGGGSADAAAALHLLNQAAGNPFTSSQLLELGAAVGMDVPFCLRGGCARLQGLGSELTALPRHWQGQAVLLMKPKRGQSTPLAFRLYDELNTCPSKLAGYRPDSSRFLKAWQALSNEVWQASGNVFEAVLALQDPEQLRRWQLCRAAPGCLAAHLSGSGTAYWAVFEDEEALFNYVQAQCLSHQDIWWQVARFA